MDRCVTPPHLQCSGFEAATRGRPPTTRCAAPSPGKASSAPTWPPTRRACRACRAWSTPPRFAFTTNQAKYDSLPADLKTVIDDNSGLATSAWAGETAFDAVVAPHQKIAQDAGEKIHRLPEAEYARWGAG